MSTSTRARAKSFVSDFRSEHSDAARSNATSTASSRHASRPGTPSSSPIEATAAPRPPSVPVLALGAAKRVAANAANPAHGSAAQGSTGATSLQRCLVFCRLRPTRPRELADGAFELLRLNGKTVAVHDDKKYEFDGTFGSASAQRDIFDVVAKPSVDFAMEGFRAALCAYGQTGSGKSHTVCCMKPGEEGIIPRSAAYLFERIAADPDRRYTVTLQLLQIYRDSLGDLMSDSGREKVDIFFDKDDGVTLPGCSAHVVASRNEFVELFEVGYARRVTTATAMNPESSRGHAALMVWISSISADDECGPRRHGKITFIDLAGYERFSKTGISNANTIMKDEAKTINASLLSLGHVVSSLSNGDKHVPWRNSKLTRILQDSIGGRSRTTIILTVGPSSDHLHETTNTLQFGQRAMAVKVAAKTTESVDYVRLAAKLQAMLEEKEERINTLELEVATHQAAQEELRSMHERDVRSLRASHDDELQRLRAAGESEDRIRHVLEQHEIEKELMLQQQREELEYALEDHEKQTLAIVQERERTAALEWAGEKVELRERIAALEREVAALQAAAATSEGSAPADARVASLEQAVAERDAIIAERAAEIADLATRLAESEEQQLSEGIERGGDGHSVEAPLFSPRDAAPITTSVVDAAVLHEAEQRHADEVADLRRRLAELQLELDEQAGLCGRRAADIAELTERNRELEAMAGAATGSSGGRSLRVERVELVDAKQLERVQAQLQHDLDMKDSIIANLRRQLYPGGIVASESPANTSFAGTGLPATTPRLAFPVATPRPMGGSNMGVTPRPHLVATPRRSTRTRGSAIAGAAPPEIAKFQLEALRAQLDTLQRENATLRDAIAAGAKKRREEGDDDDDAEEERTAVLAAPGAATMAELLEAKTAEADALFARVEEVATKAARGGQGDPLEPPSGAVCAMMDTLLGLLRRERDANRVLRVRLLERADCAEDNSGDRDATAETLASLDAELNLKDSALAELGLTVARLEARLGLCERSDEGTSTEPPPPPLPSAVRMRSQSAATETADAPATSSGSDADTDTPSPTEAPAQLRARAAELEVRLRRRVDELARARVHIAQLRKRIPAAVGGGGGGDDAFSSGVAGPEGVLVDTSDLNIIIDCKEAELRIVHYRLEQRERILLRANEKMVALERYAADLRDQVTQTGGTPLAPPAACVQCESGGGDPDGCDEDVGSVSAARHQLEGLLHLLKSVRKQNGVLHAVIMQRNLLLRRYCWLLIDRDVLMKDEAARLSTDVDPAADLRLAFAERDEEIAIKDQALLSRSTEVVVLEEALTALHGQLCQAGLTPCRPLSRFSAYTVEARQEAQREVIQRQASRAKLQERRLALQEEAADVEKLLGVCLSQLSAAPKRDGAPDAAQQQHQELLSKIAVLRERLDCLRNDRELVEAQCAAHDQELEMLRQILAQSTKALLEMHAEKDLHVGLSVMERFKTRFFKK